ncbi:MAG: acylphosphatase [Thermoplasmata archaeon HGW-Thermoplasmata-1]|nr:MAG: acylphosphatase [Thermoplasmata archaeon HGW-Thermoplasmata-1]
MNGGSGGSSPVRVRIIAAGGVQGVWYRASAQKRAVELGLAGWVKNLPDGSVEAVFEGEPQNVRAILEWCGRGPPAARVDSLKVFHERASGEFLAFEIM